MKRIFISLLILVLPFVFSAPADLQNTAFALAESDDIVKTERPKGVMRILQEISENSYVKDFMSLLDIVGSASAAPSPAPSPLPVARGVRIQNNNRRVAIRTTAQNSFEQSLSKDDAPRKIMQADERRIPPSADIKTISKEDWAQTLFGERGVLTGIFQMMDQQRKAQPHTQSDSTTINGKKLDLKEIFNSLLMGSKKGELGDPGPELPEFLGICNRLSCGDIYKAIDKFRRSDFFSNFQTALSLIQDENGWETIGKLLSNPELISQFTGGSGMEQIFGSAIGEAKKESNKTNVKNSKLLPEDGDFGIDFSEDGEEKKENKTPDIDFSVDGGQPETSDYYEEVSKGTNISPDEDELEEKTVDVAPPPSLPSTTLMPTLEKKPEIMPDLSFSIDEATEDENGETTVVDLAPPSKTTIGASGQRPFVVTTTTTTRRPTTTTTRTSTSRPTTRWAPPPTTTPKTTTKNYRKDSDYYAMYYDEQPR